MTPRHILFMILTGLFLAGLCFLLLFRLPATVSIQYAADSDFVWNAASTEKFTDDERNADVFPVAFKKCSQPEEVSFQIPVSELRFLYFDVAPATSMQIRGFRFDICGLFTKESADKELRKFFRTDNRVKAQYDDGEKILYLVGTDQTGDLRLNIANDFPRLIPFLSAGLVLILTVLVWLLLRKILNDKNKSLSGKMPGYLLIAFFLIFIYAVPAFGPVINGPPEVPAPELKLSSITKYPKDFSGWYRYYLPFRRNVFDYYHAVAKKIGLDPNKDVIIGDDSFLFFRRETDVLREHPYDDYIGTNLYTEQEKELILKNLTMMQEVLNKRGIRFAVFIAPNKVMVYPEKLPAKFQRKDPDGPTKTKDLAEYIRAHSTIPVIYPLDELKKAAASVPVPIYLRHDTHWNALGAYVGTRELLKTVLPEYAAKMPELSELKLSLAKPYRGDLANIMEAPDEMIETEIYTPKDWSLPVGVTDAYGYYTLPPASNNGPRCFLIRDSFLVDMIPYLNQCFSQCAFYWSYQLNLEQIDIFKPDIVILETVERFSDRLLYLKETQEKLGRIEKY